MNAAYLVFHIATLSIGATGYFLGSSAADVGALAPVVASAGASMLVYTAIAEGLFVLYHAARLVIKWKTPS